MYKKIFSHVGKYKKYAILAPITITGEVVMEVLIPLLMANFLEDNHEKLFLVKEDINFVSRLISTHMGPWTKDREGKEILICCFLHSSNKKSNNSSNCL